MRSLVLLEKIPADKTGTINYTNVEALDPRHTGGSGDSAVVENFIFNSPAGSGATAPTTKKKALYALNKVFDQNLEFATSHNLGRGHQ